MKTNAVNVLHYISKQVFEIMMQENMKDLTINGEMYSLTITRNDCLQKTLPVTGEIEARLREILAEEYKRHQFIEQANAVLHSVGTDIMELVIIPAMSRAYVLDRASGDGVRADQIAKALVAAGCDSGDGTYIHASMEKVCAALSAVSIPRENWKRPEPVEFTYFEGDECWHIWPPLSVHSKKVAHAIKFADGSIFDMVNGWRK